MTPQPLHVQRFYTCELTVQGAPVNKWPTSPRIKPALCAPLEITLGNLKKCHWKTTIWNEWKQVVITCWRFFSSLWRSRRPRMYCVRLHLYLQTEHDRLKVIYTYRSIIFVKGSFIKKLNQVWSFSCDARVHGEDKRGRGYVCRGREAKGSTN